MSSPAVMASRMNFRTAGSPGISGTEGRGMIRASYREDPSGRDEDVAGRTTSRPCYNILCIGVDTDPLHRQPRASISFASGK